MRVKHPLFSDIAKRKGLRIKGLKNGRASLEALPYIFSAMRLFYLIYYANEALPLQFISEAQALTFLTLQLSIGLLLFYP